MPTYEFELNGKQVSVDAPENISVLWTLRDKLGVTGPKYGCGIDVCKACTSHLEGKPFNPCVTDIKDIQNKKVTTIEGLAKDGILHPVQEAWLEQDVAQCGYCQPGQIMNAVALVSQCKAEGRSVGQDDLDGIRNVCRCGTYPRIREAIKTGEERM